MDSSNPNTTEQDISDQVNFTKHFSEVITPYVKRLEQNADRAFTLIELYAKLQRDANYSSQQGADDILRASVVFIHATLEDFLRTLALQLLPYASERALSSIPLSGFGPGNRVEKFSLGQLARFHGKSVDEVIATSVQNALANSNFNSVDDIAHLLLNLDINIDQVQEGFPKLQEMMERRHQIVHRADRIEENATSDQIIADIDPKDVLRWMRAVTEFVSGVLMASGLKHMVTKGVVRMEGDTVVFLDK